MASNYPRVKEESKYEFTDKSNNRLRTFKAADDQVVVTFDRAAPTEALSAIRALDNNGIYMAAPEAGFAVLRTTDMTTVRRSLAATRPVANELPVMLDEEGLQRYFLPDELTVQFVDGISDADAEKLLQQHGAAVRKKQRTPGYFTVGVPDGAGLFETIDAIAAHDEVAFAEPSEFGVDDALEGDAQSGLAEAPVPFEDLPAGEIRTLAENQDLRASLETEEDVQALPTDTHFGRLWGLHNTGQSVNGSSGSVDADIDAYEAWGIETGKKHVVVAVIDTGCDLDHPDLASNILPRGSEDWDFADGADPEPWDSHYHGTHVAGTVAARRNGQGIVGVAYNTWLMPLRVNLSSGMNQNRADAINYVATQAFNHKTSRRYVINCSWKMSGDHAGVRTAIQNAVSKNVVVVFAAGNANKDIDVVPEYPAVYPEVIAVAASDQRDQRAGFSNYGKKVDVTAPGVNIYSTVPDNTYGFLDGTSMASPHVAGVAALIWSRNPDLSNAQVRKCIETTTDNIDGKNPGYAGKLGTGRLNALRALHHVPPRKLPVRLLWKFKFPQPNAGSSTGLTYVERFPLGFAGTRPGLLFLTQKAGSERIYLLHPNSGAVMGSIDPTANDTIGSLAWDGSAIRAANVTTGAGSINRISPFTGAPVSSIPAPPGRGEGLVVVGSRTYYATISRIWELATATGAVLRSFLPPGGPSRALTYGRGLLFSGGTTGITVFDRSSLTVRGVIAAPGGGSNQAEGLAFDERRRILYVANQSENMIYALRVGGI